MSEEETARSKERKAKSASFWAELKRRKVVRVAIAYTIVAWLLIQVAATVFPGFGIPDWAFRFVVIMLVLGFPVSLIIAWALELTPEGIKLTRTAERATPAPEASDAILGKRRWLAFGIAAAVPTLIFGTLALVFYSIGVWAERLALVIRGLLCPLSMRQLMQTLCARFSPSAVM